MNPIKKQSWWKKKFTLNLPFGNKVNFTSGTQFVIIALIMLLFFKEELRIMVGIQEKSNPTGFMEKRINLIEKQVDDIKFDKVSSNTLQSVLNNFYTDKAKTDAQHLARIDSLFACKKTEIIEEIKQTLRENFITLK